MMKLRKPDFGWQELGAGFSALVLAFSLTACGGGGGGGGGGDDDTSGTSDTSYSGSTVTATIDDSNDEDVAAATVSGTTTSTGTADSGSTAGVSGKEAALGVIEHALRAHRLAPTSGDDDQVFAGATETEKTDCSGGGTVTTTYNPA